MLTAVTRSLWLAGMLAAAAGMLLSVLLARRIAAPLAEVARAAHRIAAGDLAQGGQMGVESAPGSGSRFWFTLPTLSTTTAAHLPA
jgi:nitrogen fixation/metabolism regulation signal transduction histidine kinase